MRSCLNGEIAEDECFLNCTARVWMFYGKLCERTRSCWPGTHRRKKLRTETFWRKIILLINRCSGMIQSIFVFGWFIFADLWRGPATRYRATLANLVCNRRCIMWEVWLPDVFRNNKLSKISLWVVFAFWLTGFWRCLISIKLFAIK